MIFLFLGATVPGCYGTGGEESPALSSPGDESVEGDDFFIAVHCEPGKVPLSNAYAAGNWPALTELVQSADAYHMKLTLLFSPQWIMYILEDDGRLELVHRWEARGHEIGLCHHGPHIDTWDGYTDQANYFSSRKYVGRTEAMMVLVKQIPASGQVATAFVNSADREFDFPRGISYEISSGSGKLEDLSGNPTEVTINGQQVLRLTCAGYAAQKNRNKFNLEEISQLLNENEGDEIMGVAFHTFEYAEKPEPFDGLFELLDGRGIHTSSVSSIMEFHR
ncbi:MAG: hypothetical protein R6U37_08580 [Dehalococcoidia bacterium]